MKSILISLLLLLNLQLFASDIQNYFIIKPQTADCGTIFKSGDKDILAQSGRVTCCDGSYGPSCTCKGGDVK